MSRSDKSTPARRSGRGVLLFRKPRSDKKASLYFISHEDLEQFRLEKNNVAEAVKLLESVPKSQSHVLALCGDFVCSREDDEECPEILEGPCCLLKINKLKAVLGEE